MSDTSLVFNILAKEKMTPVLGGLKGKAAAAGKGIAVALGAGVAGAAGLLAKGLSDALDLDEARSKMTAQLGLTQAQSATAGKVAGKLFADNYGESMQDVGSAVTAVIQNLDGMRGASAATLRTVTAGAMTASTVLDEDVVATTRAAAQMMRTGLAKSSKEAFDILVSGAQHGANKAQDLLDTFNEYGTQFRRFGLTGQQSMALIQQGLQAGARDADTVADAIKEFAINSVSGSTAVTHGFKALGLNAKEVTRQFGAGGSSANKALDTVLDRLRAMPDPVKRAQTAVALFGTKAEDLGDALYALDPSAATRALGKVAGATDAASKALNDNAKAGIESWKRHMDGLLMQAATAPGALGKTSQALIGIGQSVLPLGSDIGGFAMAMMAASKVAGGPMLTALKAVGSGVMWLGRLMLTNPWMLLAVGIAIVAVLIITHWNTVKHATQAAWSWVVGKVKTGAHAVMAAIGFLGSLPGKVGGYFGRMKDAAVAKAMSLVGWVRGLPGRIRSAIGNLGGLLVNAGMSVVHGLWNGIVRMGSWLYHQVLSWISSVVPGPIKHVLGIASPSKLAAQYGMYWAQGLGGGLTSGIPLVQRASGALAGAISAPGRASLGAARSASGVRVAGGVARLVIDLRGGDREMRKLVRKWIRDGGGDVQVVMGPA
jgi:phage-related minor tail protein